MAKQRIYLVTAKGVRRLIRATHRQQAIAYVANSMLECRVAEQDDLVQCLTGGIDVEDSRAPDQLELIESSESPAN